MCSSSLLLTPCRPPSSVLTLVFRQHCNDQNIKLRASRFGRVTRPAVVPRRNLGQRAFFASFLHSLAGSQNGWYNVVSADSQIESVASTNSLDGRFVRIDPCIRCIACALWSYMNTAVHAAFKTPDRCTLCLKKMPPYYFWIDVSLSSALVWLSWSVLIQPTPNVRVYKHSKRYYP